MTVRITKPEINISEKLSELDKPSGVAGESLLRAETPQEAFNLIGAGRKNLIINGAAQVAQRATSANPVVYYSYNTADRWRFSSNGVSGAAISQEVIEDQNIGDLTLNAIKITVSTAATSQAKYAGNNYRVDSADLKPYVGRPLTFSFYAKADAPVAIECNGGTGGGNAFESIKTLSTEWARYEVTFTLDAEPTNYLDLILRQDCTVETSTYFTGLQLEAGPVATPFELRTYGEELALCHRYYRIVSARSIQMHYVVPWTEYYGIIGLENPMRTTPSVSFGFNNVTNYQPGGGSGTSMAAMATSNTAIRISSEGTQNGYDDVYMYLTDNNNSSIYLNAEL